MNYEWDDIKRAKNIQKHGIDFVEIVHFDWGSALETLDDLENYNEARFKAIGFIQGRLMSLVYTMRGEEVMRIISLRRVTKKEERAYYGD